MSIVTKVATVTVDGIKVFYRYAGPENGPVFLLLHGFPSSSFQFNGLIPLLAAKGYRVVAPDLPGYGFTEVPAERKYVYSFANIAETIKAFIDELAIKRFAVYIFDYGAPTGLRIAIERPEAVAAIVTQNGNAYVEGFGAEFWAPIKKTWEADTTEADRDALRPALELETTKWQYVNGAAHPESVQPEHYYLDQALMDRPGNKEIQLDLFKSYATNVPLYPKFQEYFRTSGVPVLAAWGKHDPIFIYPGAEAYARDVKKFELHAIDAGHFAAVGNEELYANLIHNFFEKHSVFKQ